MIEDKRNQLYKNQKQNSRTRSYTKSYFNPFTFIIGIFGFLIFWKYFEPLKIYDFQKPEAKEKDFEKEYISKHY